MLKHKYLLANTDGTFLLHSKTI
uniref:Uncharacterized protein n=1 Tax=Rhizophora mucronata TaxID=61149 RepID=A0A2P2QUD6_RHIMU